MKKHLITFILIASAFTSFSQDLCLQEKNYQIKNQKVIKISNKITTYYFFTVNGIGSILEYNSQVLRVRCSPSPNVCIGIYDLADGSGRLGLHYYDGPDRVRLNFTLESYQQTGNDPDGTTYWQFTQPMELPPSGQ